MSLLTVFGITSAQKANKKKRKEKKRKALMVTKLVMSVRVLLKTFLFSLLCSVYHIPRSGIWVNFPPFRVFGLRVTFRRSAIYGRPQHYYRYKHHQYIERPG